MKRSRSESETLWSFRPPLELQMFQQEFAKTHGRPASSEQASEVPNVPRVLPILPREIWTHVAKQYDVRPSCRDAAPRLNVCSIWQSVSPSPSQQGSRALATLALVSRAMHNSVTAALPKMHLGAIPVDDQFCALLLRIARGEIPHDAVRASVTQVCGHHDHLTLQLIHYPERKLDSASRSLILYSESEKARVSEELFCQQILPGIFDCRWKSLKLTFDQGLENGIRVPVLLKVLTTLMSSRLTQGEVSLKVWSSLYLDGESRLDLFGGLTASSACYFSAIDLCVGGSQFKPYEDAEFFLALRPGGPLHQRLRSLQLAGREISTKDGEHLLEALRGNTDLRTLFLCGHYLNRGSLASFNRLLSEQHKLETISISELPQYGGPWLAGLKDNSSLHTLMFGLGTSPNLNNMLESELSCIQQNKHLHHLVLTLNKLGKETGRCVASFINANKSLREFTLVTGTGVVAGQYLVLRSLRDNQVLERVTLNGMNLTEAAARTIAAALKKRKTPMHLVIGGHLGAKNNETEEVWRVLRDLLASNRLIRCTARGVELAPANR